MDILNPTLINVDGRIYCVYNDGVKSSEEYNSNATPVSVWDDEPSCNFENTDTNLVKTPDGRYKLSLGIHSAFFKYIIGVGGENRRQLQHDTKTNIEIPSIGRQGNIIITGKNSEAVLSAKNRIELLVSSKRWKEPFTHFVSVPLTEENVKCRFEEFQGNVLNDFSSDKGVNKNLFQSSSKLHLTICTLVLLNDTELERARNIFCNLVQDILSDNQLSISLSNLEYMNDDPAEVNVLYGKVRCLDDSDRLQSFADQVAERFIKEGFSENQYDRVKLHCTLMNSIFSRGNDRNSPRRTFDASRILMKYQDYDFGNLTIKEIHLSQRGSFTSNGYYKAAEKVSLFQ